MRNKDTRRAVGRHVARFILVGLYTGTRSSAICGAALMPTIGRGHIDLEQGLFYRRAIGRRQTKKRQPPVKLPTRLLAHLRRWERLGLARKAVVEWNGKPVESVRKGFETAVRAAGLGAEVTPHILRHTCATWLMQSGVNLWEAARFSGHDGAAARAKLRTSPPGLSGASRCGIRGPARGTKPREQRRTIWCERYENRRYFKGRKVNHHVRDVGVAGSNPATPTNT